jgi:hypothetical protein
LKEDGIFSSTSKKKENSTKEKEAVKSILQTRGTLSVQDPDTRKRIYNRKEYKKCRYFKNTK